MAQPRLVFFLLLVLIFCQCMEARHLKLVKQAHSHEKILEISEPTVGVSQTSSPAQRNVDDFRPTTPGHSPGVGHSLKNQGFIQAFCAKQYGTSLNQFLLARVSMFQVGYRISRLISSSFIKFQILNKICENKNVRRSLCMIICG